ncbi:hypothetical protein TTHERM_000691222 (macronuclear) [Tetrahymena thermophila SB210]|uniref:Uncharacterized protein n=1 Tax=Tetrahymena thermophila (strain SB210) TaxID=312017 RepID=W7WZ63_TETTS|nr:hypothetical protein TTHERM_000691222 [Tetrahymena thermophila SB210]EWS72180.1 hypothetical protein TTHERM_000691222 [Tetrahymena thermophila SB210]|eukprot:XP_012655273.1 hypothetical protein TTHERM_000691222 [Tetrahymena thermophila SB210]
MSYQQQQEISFIGIHFNQNQNSRFSANKSKIAKMVFKKDSCYYKSIRNRLLKRLNEIHINIKIEYYTSYFEIYLFIYSFILKQQIENKFFVKIFQFKKLVFKQIIYFYKILEKYLEQLGILETIIIFMVKQTTYQSIFNYIKYQQLCIQKLQFFLLTRFFQDQITNQSSLRLQNCSQ